jgi:hypothetical protein
VDKISSAKSDLGCDWVGGRLFDLEEKGIGLLFLDSKNDVSTP